MPRIASRLGAKDRLRISWFFPSIVILPGPGTFRRVTRRPPSAWEKI
jgi:hypothetical protein